MFDRILIKSQNLFERAIVVPPEPPLPPPTAAYAQSFTRSVAATLSTPGSRLQQFFHQSARYH